MDGIPLSDEFFKKFEAGNFSDSSAETGGNEEDLEYLNQLAGYLLDTIDDGLESYTKSIGGTPEEAEKIVWNPTTRSAISKASVVVAKKRFSIETLKQSPELFVGAMLAGKLITTGIVLKQINDRQGNQKNESKEESEDE